MSQFKWNGFVFVLSCLHIIVDKSSAVTSNFTKSDTDKLEKFTQNLMNCRRIPGLSMTVVSSGNPVVTKGFGFADVESTTPANSNTQFCVASLTKAFTSTLLGKVLKRYGHSWDTYLTDILDPDYRFLDNVTNGRATVRDLLLHRTGVPRYDYLWIAGVYKRNQLFRHTKCMKQKEKFRSTTLYNNIMYSLAGEVVEVLTNKSYESNLREEILAPLGMLSTNFRHEEVPPGVARASQYGFIYVGGPLLKMTADKFGGAESVASAISLCTTPSDMAKWIKLNLDGNSDIVDDEVLNEIHRGQIPAAHMVPSRIKPPLSSATFMFDTYGLGWFVGEYRGHRALMHYGSFPGFYSLITIVPSLNFGIYTSINGGEQDYPWTLNSLIHTVAIDLALDQGPWLTAEASCTFPPGSLEMMNSDPFVVDTSYKPQRPLKDYTGLYYHPIFNNVTFSQVNKTHLETLIGNIKFHVFPNSEKDTFTLLVIDKGWYVGPSTITFSQGKGSPNTINSVQIPFLEPNDPPLFKRPPTGRDFSQWRHEQEDKCRAIPIRESSYRLVSNTGDKTLFATFTILMAIFMQALVLEEISPRRR